LVVVVLTGFVAFVVDFTGLTAVAFTGFGAFTETGFTFVVVVAFTGFETDTCVCLGGLVFGPP
jgi:hypothetical protein